LKNSPDFYFVGFRASFPDPNSADVGVFGPGADPGKWQNAEYTRLITEADRQTDPQQRLAMYKQAEQISSQDAARVFVLWFGTFRLIKPYVKGLTYTSRDFLPGQSSFKDAYILKH
jgi:oligopeptide transport system substrate-binding protein